MTSTSAPTRYPVTVDDYVRFRTDGFLIVRGLVARDEVRELLDHVDDLLAGRVEVPGAPAFGDDNKTAEARLDHLLRVHMLHRRLEIHERCMLHPRVLDVVQALIGPDVLALQTMLFVKRPGSSGQGYHQDSFHIITQPDTLIGAWIALDRADAENGCVWNNGRQPERARLPRRRRHARPRRRPPRAVSARRNSAWSCTEWLRPGTRSSTRYQIRSESEK